jgi:hypothetical protein
MKFKDWTEKKELDEGMGFVQQLDTKKSKPSSQNTRKVNEPKNIEKALKKYVKGIQDIVNQDYKKNYTNLTPPDIIYKKGGRYYKVIRKETFGSGQSVHSFIDAKEGPEFGNIYKAASWRAPAKGARGNVFSPSNGMEAIGHRGSVWYAKTGRR